MSASGADATGRRRVAGVMAATAVVLAVVALALSYVGRALLRPEPFADRAVATLHDPAVQDDVADRLTEALTRSGTGDLVAVRPLVRALAGSLVSGKAFAALFRRAVLEAHAAVVERSGGRILVAVADAGVLVQGLLERFAPGAARKIGADRLSTLFTVKPDAGVLDVVRTVRRLYSAAWVLGLVAFLAAAGALLISHERRRTGHQLGIGLLAGGLVLVALLTLGRAIVEQAAPSGRGAAAGAAWDAFLGGLRAEALWLAAAGAICAGAASGRLRPGSIVTGLAQGRRLLAGAGPAPERRLVAAVGLIAIGIVIVLEPAAVLATVVQAGGLFVLYRGAETLLSAGVTRAREPAVTVLSWGRSAARFAPVAVAVIALGAAAAVIVTGADDEAPAATPLTCNGFVALCDRPLNDVALAATHNSMASVTIPSWLFGQQDGTISDQLDAGIRGLLIDTYNGVASPAGVRTDLERLPKREVAVRELGAPAVDAALRIRSRLGSAAKGKSKGKPGIFLCHGFCELGAVPLASALADLRSFLVANPGEVVVVINQDEGVAPSDIERAFADAGLLDLVYRGPPGPFPTAHALQETPFKFKSAAALTDAPKLDASCRPNRGPASAPLFLLNHWVDTSQAPRPSLAATVNARAALLARADRCRQIRHRLPNLVAVDFYRRGDLLPVVNALNGVGR